MLATAGMAKVSGRSEPCGKPDYDRAPTSDEDFGLQESGPSPQSKPVTKYQRTFRS